MQKSYKYKNVHYENSVPIRAHIYKNVHWDISLIFPIPNVKKTKILYTHL